MNNRRFIFLIIIYILFICLLSNTAFSAESSFVYYYNLGNKYANQGNNELAIKNYQKAINLNPKFSPALKNLEISYYNLGVDYANSDKYELAVQSYKKALTLNNKNDNIYFALANVYSYQENYDLAILNYKKALAINSNHNLAKKNLQIILERKEAKAIQDNIMNREKKFTDNLNNVKASRKAPDDLYGLVRLQYGNKYDTNTKTFGILDLIWSDPEGQKLLNVIRNNKILINITMGGNYTNANLKTVQYKQNITWFGIPIVSLDAGQDKNVVINIGEDHIRAFRDPSLSTHQRIYALHVVTHELCHAVKGITSKEIKNAISEELTASMIGYNITLRIIRGEGLTEKETYDYSRECLQAILSDDHRSLPVYDNFVNDIQKIGIYPPYFYIYQNIVEVYRSIRNNPNVQKLDTLEGML